MSRAQSVFFCTRQLETFYLGSSGRDASPGIPLHYLVSLTGSGGKTEERLCRSNFYVKGISKTSLKPPNFIPPGGGGVIDLFLYGQAPPGGSSPYPFLPKWHPFHIPRAKLHPFLIPQA